jgi:hypothetical protein
MIRGKQNLNFNYFSKYRQENFNVSVHEQKIIESYFREELKILPEHKIDYKSPEVLLLVDLIRFSNYLS